MKIACRKSNFVRELVNDAAIRFDLIFGIIAKIAYQIIPDEIIQTTSDFHLTR